MATINITTFTNDNLTCRSYFNDDQDQGIEIYRDTDEYLGKILDESIPDENDEDEVEEFTSMVENWMVDNDHY